MPAPPAAAVHRPQPPPRRITKATRRGPSGPRYHRAPLDDGFWATVIDEEVLLILSTGYRVCALITEVTADALAYEDPEGEPRTVARSLVTAVHEASWECDTTSPLPKVEWVLPGTITGSILASAGLVFGVLADTGAISEPSTFAIFAYPAVLFGAPLVGAAGRSAGHDLRVRGIPWARGVGWAAFGGSALSLVFWSVGHLGGVEAFERPGLASAAGGLGFVGAGLLGLDGLRSRAELRALQRHDAEPPSARQSLRLGLTPLVAGGQVHGVGFGISGRLGGG